MTNIDELLKVTQSVVSSYESKVNTVTTLMREVERKIIDAYEDQSGAIQKIKDTLAKSRNLRKRDFDRLINPVIDLQNHWKEQIHILSEDFYREEKENISEFKRILEGKGNCSLEAFSVLKEKVLCSRPKAREAHLSELLKSFRQNQAELDVFLRWLLKNGDNIELKALNKAIHAFQAAHFGDGILMNDVPKEFSEIKEDISHLWEAVVNTVGHSKFATQSPDD